MQLKSEAKVAKLSNFQTAKDLFMNEGGLKGFYKGIGSALMRQIVYTGLRLGIFYTALDVAKEKWNHPLSASEKALASLCAGGLAAFVATPFDLALIRFQADGTLPVKDRRNYKNWADALSKITKTEGFLNLWKGATPTIVRAMALNLGMLGPYEECKIRLKPYLGNGYSLYIGSSFVAGFLAAFLCLPFDNTKTKIQKMRKGADGKFPYKGFIDCMLKTAKNEGVLRYWVGFSIFYVRIGGHAMLTLLFSDLFKYLILGKK